VVRVEGELTRIVETQYGKAVTDAVAAQQAAVERLKATTASEEQLRYELRRSRRQVRQLSEQARTRVVASYVEAADAQTVAISQDEARQLAREFQILRRERRTATARAQVQAKAEVTIETPAEVGKVRPRRKSSDGDALHEAPSLAGDIPVVSHDGVAHTNGVDA
jgi:hypothetical protein